MQNLTHEEEFRVTGTLNSVAIEKLLDGALKTNGIKDAIIHIEEAETSLPAEDFLYNIKNSIRELIKRTRGENRELLVQLAEDVDDLELYTYNESEAVRDELNQAKESLK